MEEGTLSLPTHLSLDSVPSSKGFPMCCHAEMAEHFTVPLGCCSLQSTRLEIKLLQPHGCMTAEQCGHGKSKPLCCALGLRFTSLCSLSSSSCLKFFFTETYSHSQSLRVKRVLSNAQSCSNLFWLVIITEMSLYLMWPAGEKQHSQDSTPPSPPPPNVRETFKRGQPYDPCVQRGQGFGSRHSSDILQNGFYCCFSPNGTLINAVEKDEKPWTFLCFIMLVFLFKKSCW